MSLRKRLLARWHDAMMRRYEEYMAERKRSLFAGVAGTVLEIGPGTGANLRYLASAANWIGIEPNCFMHSRLKQRAAECGFPVDLRQNVAEQLNVSAESVDCVVSTLVLCSVSDPAQVVAQIHGVLKQHGRFLFIEHVAAPEGTWLRRWQGVIRPFWQFLGDGCRTNRDTREIIESAGFQSVEIQEFRVPHPPVPPWVSPHIAGVAVKQPETRASEVLPTHLTDVQRVDDSSPA